MIQQHLCEMENIIENVRWRLYRTVTMLDNGESTRLESALLKGYACRELTRVPIWRCRSSGYWLHERNAYRTHLGRPSR